MSAVMFEIGDGPVVPLLVWVDRDQVLEVQSKLPSWLATFKGPATSAGGGYEPPHSATHGDKNAWTLEPWGADHLPAAKWILSVLGDGQRKILAALLGAEKGLWTSELRTIGGYPEDTRMSGPFKAIGGRFRRTGHRPLWNGDKVKDSKKGQLLWVGEEQARAVFATALVAGWPDVAAEFGVTP
jgi:hypothetical protein